MATLLEQLQAGAQGKPAAAAGGVTGNPGSALLAALQAGAQGKPVGDAKPIGDTERAILQNLFDTQPERRRAYLKKLGWEMGPDENKIRPIGDKTDWKEVRQKIDPGFEDVTKKGALLANLGGNLQAIAKEAGRDVGDIVYDVLSGGLETSAGLSALGFGASVGGPGVGIVLGMAGAGTAKAGSEGIKKELGDLFLEEDIPPDLSLAALQSVISGLTFGIAPSMIRDKVMRGGSAAISDFLADRVRASRKNLIEATARTGRVTPEVLKKYAENPELFAPENVQGATKRLGETFRRFFGQEAGDDFRPTKVAKDIPRDSEFGKRLSSIHQEADVEAARIIADPKSVTTYGEYIKPMVDKLKELSSRRMTKEETQAFDIIQREIKQLGEQAGIKGNDTGKIIRELQNKPLSFDNLDRNVDIIQDAAFTEGAHGTVSQNPVVGSIAKQLREVRDNVANQSFERRAAAGQPLGRPYSLLKAEQSHIMDVYNKAGKAITPQKLRSAFVGELSSVAGADDVLRALDDIDGTLGTNFKERIQNGQFQAEIERLHTRADEFGGPSKVEAAIKGGGAGAATGLGVSAVTFGGVPASVAVPVGTLSGAAKGVANASKLASPQAALEAIRNATTKEASLRSAASAARAAGGQTFAQTPVRSAIEEALSQAAVQGPRESLSRELAPSLQEGLGLAESAEDRLRRRLRGLSN